MSLKMNFGSREWMLLQNLGNGSIDWDDLSFGDKRIVMQSGIDITDTVEKRKIRRFERRLEKRRKMEGSGRIERIINRMTQPLSE